MKKRRTPRVPVPARAMAQALAQALALALAFTLSMAAPALAYIDYVPMMSNGAWQANSASYIKKWRKYVDGRQIDAQPGTRPPAQPAATATLVPPAAHPSSAPGELAEAYPAEQRGEIAQAFGELLRGYRKIEQQFGIPRDDMAGAVAALIAGSWMAYRNRDFPDANFPPLVAQMRGILAANPGFRNASAVEKRETFDRMVILGTLMATAQMAQKQHPDPRAAANTREAARGYLEQFLQTDAERIELNAQGLQLR
jgi:hypothetical protein